MDNLDKVRARQQGEKNRAGAPGLKKREDSMRREGTVTAAKQNTAPQKGSRKKKKKHSTFGIVFKVVALLLIAIVIFCAVWVALTIDFSFGDNLSGLNLNLSSTVYYIDEDGNPKRFEEFEAGENRIWVSIDKMPKHLQDAFVAIEDQRFYKHHGVDLKRTTGAVINYVFKGDSSYGGSTITQQLVKNITNDKERTKTRKIREMIRSVILESKMSKEQILEMYMNTIYLSQGSYGVQAAANAYFSKDVSELTIAESACIAGITQYPSLYDPILQPENNAKKQKLVLEKMLELEFITEDEFNEALNEKLKIRSGEEVAERVHSYFLDQLFEVLLEDLMEKGYSEQFASNMIYNGGLKIYSTVDPKVQSAMEEVFENDANFPGSGENKPQSAMIISDPKTGQIKGVVGGRGKKDGNRVLNRVSQTTRQPGSSIKPIAVYAPALDLGLITMSTDVEDSPFELGNWKPKNSGGGFRGWVTVRDAVTWSYNIPAIRVLETLTVDKSYEYLTERLNLTTLVPSSDKNLPALALGGLTDGVNMVEINAAYTTFANGGKYIEPSLYTKVYDVDGRVILEKTPKENRAFSEETAYITSMLLKNVVTSGTGGGAQISNMDTCGKTGTTDDNKDRWFIGYTPYYVGSVWFGYDKPKTLPSSSGNPSLAAWKKVMDKIHEPLPAKHFVKPDSVEKLTVCSRTGKKPSSSCPVVTEFVSTRIASEQCNGVHERIGTMSEEELEEEFEKSGYKHNYNLENMEESEYFYLSEIPPSDHTDIEEPSPPPVEDPPSTGNSDEGIPTIVLP